MSDPRPRLIFLSRDLSGPVEPGRTLHEEIRRLGHVLEGACGGGALCGTCCVLVYEGEERLAPPDTEEAARLAEMKLSPEHRLACRARVAAVEGEITIVAC
ncbi:MAG TPA: 2Fe-2S iron-sulfur cluster-binding protein [Candidatus Polarisedimenticolia bacterium]